VALASCSGRSGWSTTATNVEGTVGVQRLCSSGKRLGVKNGTATTTRLTRGALSRTAADHTPIFSLSSGSR